MTSRLFVSPEAEADIEAVLEWSVARFGNSVRDGYEELINIAVRSLLVDSERLGSHDRPDLGRGVRVLHLAVSRDDVGDGVRRIAKPRHVVVYRQIGQTLQGVRLLHDAMDLPQHYLP